MRIDVFQCAIHRQFAKHDRLRNRQYRIALRTFQIASKVIGHDPGQPAIRRHAPTGFGIDTGRNDEHRAGFSRGGVYTGGQVDVLIEAAVGGFVEFLRIDWGVWGTFSVSGGLGVTLNKDGAPDQKKGAITFATKRKGWWPYAGW
ncbi:hypothetical protein ABH909_004755 [Pseudomonas sp. BS3782 TE3695]